MDAETHDNYMDNTMCGGLNGAGLSDENATSTATDGAGSTATETWALSEVTRTKLSAAAKLHEGYGTVPLSILVLTLLII